LRYENDEVIIQSPPDETVLSYADTTNIDINILFGKSKH
jgi:hypothetical protein